MKEVNRIVVCRDKYKSQEEFENAIKKAVMVLLDNDYIMTVRYDEKGLGIVCIDFNESDQSLGCAYPYWLLPEQIENLEDSNDEDVE